MENVRKPIGVGFVVQLIVFLGGIDNTLGVGRTIAQDLSHNVKCRRPRRSLNGARQWRSVGLQRGRTAFLVADADYFAHFS